MKKVAVLIPYLRDEKIDNVVHLATVNAGIPEADFVVIAEKLPELNVNEAYNFMTEKADAEWFCFIADDTLPEPGYLKEALDAMSQFPGGFGVVALNEGFDRDRPSHLLVHRKMIPLLGGEIYYSNYNHNCSDIEIKERALSLGRYVFSKEAVVLHIHPNFVEGVKTDAVYESQKKHKLIREDQLLLKSRRAAGWPIINIKDYR
jgi:hypothetical protein